MNMFVLNAFKEACMPCTTKYGKNLVFGPHDDIENAFQFYLGESDGDSYFISFEFTTVATEEGDTFNRLTIYLENSWSGKLSDDHVINLQYLSDMDKVEPIVDTLVKQFVERPVEAGLNDFHF